MTAAEHRRLRLRNDTRMERPHRRRITGTTPSDREDLRSAVRKAKYGHRDWLAWVDRKGTQHCAVQTADSLKRALLDTGTQYCFTQIGANDGQRMLISWPIGLNMLRKTRHGSLSNAS